MQNCSHNDAELVSEESEPESELEPEPPSSAESPCAVVFAVVAPVTVVPELSCPVAESSVAL
jgi:hypothetical protein